jgi:hypothetical protein
VQDNGQIPTRSRKNCWLGVPTNSTNLSPNASRTYWEILVICLLRTHWFFDFSGGGFLSKNWSIFRFNQTIAERVNRTRTKARPFPRKILFLNSNSVFN